ncbi:MAG: RNA methyltransferase [Candidatus Aminicenantes bacterium]|nr:RNA methyltransferase [Candidatus Aminicenantes bacterium]
MPTPQRVAKVKAVLEHRQPDLRVVIDHVLIAHNASAVLRTCDAAGILYVDLISPNPAAIEFNRAISTRADKWLEISIYETAEECLRPLKEKGFQIIATHLGPDSISFREVDYTRPTVLLFGSEAEGVTPQALIWADKKIKIPMFGMVQSLNLSVSVGIILFEALRQREAKGFFRERRLPDKEYSRLLKKWLHLPDEGLEEKKFESDS